MSWSLKVSNGDLSPAPASLDSVSGAQKLVQDLRLWILERMGTDNLHPRFGSLIDGGTTPEGNELPGVIGSESFAEGRAFVESEIRRICREYQMQQLARVKQDRVTLGRATLTPAEVLRDVTSIDFSQYEDALLVNVTLSNGLYAQLNIDLSF